MVWSCHSYIESANTLPGMYDHKTYVIFTCQTEKVTYPQDTCKAYILYAGLNDVGFLTVGSVSNGSINAITVTLLQKPIPE